MRNFQKLQEAYKQQQKRADEYRRESVAVGFAFAEELQRFLECSSDELYLFPVVGKRDLRVQYNTFGAMQIGDDGFWQFAVAFKLHALTQFGGLRRRCSILSTSN